MRINVYRLKRLEPDPQHADRKLATWQQYEYGQGEVGPLLRVSWNHRYTDGLEVGKYTMIDDYWLTFAEEVPPLPDATKG